MASTGPYALVVPLLSYINADIGPSNQIIWVALAHQLSSSVVYLLVGRLSDVFGRRWFFILGSCFGLLGCIIGATAQNVNTLIGGQVFCGLGTGFQLSAFWVISEIVPMRYRLIGVSSAYIFAIPTSPLAAKISSLLQNNTSSHWRTSYYILIAINAASVLCWYFFYHPPTYKMLHRRTAAKTLLRRFDWIGLVLFVAGLFTLLMGLSWGGVVYPWKSGRVIGCIVGGAFLLAVFFVWEIFLPLGSDPYIPSWCFKNGRFQACAWIAAIGASVFYAYALIWPSAVAVIYSEHSTSYKATITGLPTMGVVFGQIVGGYVGTWTGPKWGTIAFMYICVPILAGCAYDPLNEKLTTGLMITGTFFNGMMESIAVTATTFPLKNQAEIGTAGGLAGTIRSTGSTIAVTILSTVLTNRLGKTIPKYVVQAATAAGLPVSSIPALISGLGGLTPLNSGTVPGLTSKIIASATQAYKVAYAEAFKTVFLVNLAFGGCGLILVWFVMDKDKDMEQFVGAHIHNTKDEKALENDEPVPVVT